MRGDLRSRRVAVVADSVLNPPAGGADHLTPLAESGWGIVVLPPAGLPAGTERAMIAAITDQVVTFLDDGYEVALGWPGDERTGRLIEALGGSSFYLALYLQSGAAGYSPSRASLVFVPISLVMFVLAARFGRLADRHGPRRYLTAAPLVMSVGYVLLMFVTSTNPLRPLPGVLVLALGLAMLVAPITATALKAAPDEFAGIAAGVNTTVSRLGGLIATPLLGVVITLVFAATATHHNIDPFAKHLTPDQRDATITAFRAGILVTIGLCVAGSVVAFVWLPRAGEPHR